MSEIKPILSIIAIAMMVVGYIPYLRDTIKGKTKPHVFSWFVGVIIAFVAFGIQFQSQSGPGMYVTLSAGMVGLVILFFALKNKDKDITRMDYVYLALSMVSLMLWLFAKRPVLSMIFIVLTEILSFIPTIRKSWHAPYTETLSSYITNFFRFIIAILALKNYSFVSVGYPATWLLLNGGFALLLMYRRSLVDPSVDKQPKA